MANKRERDARAALDLVGEGRFVNFLRAAREAGGVTAIRIINEELDRGLKLEEIFFDGDELGFHAHATKFASRQFHIAFGCVAGPTAGDGAEWDVEFDEGDEVIRATGGIAWVS